MTITRTRRDGRPVADDEREEAPAAPSPVSAILDLQRGAGNAAVARWLRADSAGGHGGAAPAAQPYWPEAGYEGAEEETEGDATPEATSGSIEDIEGQEITTGGCDRPDEAGPPLRLRTNLTIISGTSDAPAAPPKPDAVAGTLAFGSKVKKGGATPGGGEFGVEKVKYKVDSMKWTHDAATSTVNADARVFLDIGWGVHSLGRKNIPDENVKAVKKSTWQDIRDDLKPDGTGRPTRDKYWAKDLTERHEQFHASDDIQRAQAYVPTAKAWLDTQTVRAKHIKKDLKAHLETVRSNVEADGWAWYGAGGEDRAYADGQAEYQARADAVEARATTEGW
jgi:hypothetical protein